MLAGTPRSTPSGREFALLIGLILGALIWSGLNPTDRLTWTMEVLWVVLALPLLVLTRARFPLTRLLYWLIALHCVILVYGGAWTYAETPLGLWVQDAFDLQRNHYDRLGHFAQGFIPAILGRELLLRRTPLQPGAWLFYLVTSACLPGRCLGHPVGHVPRPVRRDHRPAAAGALACAAAAGGVSLDAAQGTCANRPGTADCRSALDCRPETGAAWH
jgi:hypothetical protein